MEFKYECVAEHAATMIEWITHRGGVALWKSADLSDLSAQWATPVLDKNGKPNNKPHWKARDTPIIITDANEIGIYTEKIFRELPVSLRRSSNGLSLKLTDASQRKLDAALDKCKAKHGNAHYHKGGLDFPCMTIYYADGEVTPLAQLMTVSA